MGEKKSISTSDTKGRKICSASSDLQEKKKDGWYEEAEMRKLDMRKMGAEVTLVEIGSRAMLNKVCDQ